MQHNNMQQPSRLAAQDDERDMLGRPRFVTMLDVEYRPSYGYSHDQSKLLFARHQPEQQSSDMDGQQSDEKTLTDIQDRLQHRDKHQKDPDTCKGDEEDDEIELPYGADGDRFDDSDYQASEPEIFQDDGENYFANYEYPEDAESDGSEHESTVAALTDRKNEDEDEDEDEEDEEEEKKPDSMIDSDEEIPSDVESLLSGQGECEVGDKVEIVDGLGSNAQAQACLEAKSTFRRANENSLSRLKAMINRHEMDGQATVGLRERQIKGRDRYFDTEDNDADIGFTPLDKGVDTDEYGRKIPANQIMEPYMFQNVKTLVTWKRPDTYTMDDVIAWSRSLPDPEDWYYSALKCYATGEIEYMQHQTVVQGGKLCKVVVGYEDDGSLKGLRKRSQA